MKTSGKRIAPGPRGRWLLGNLGEFRRDVLGLMMESVRAHGDVVRLRLGPHVIHLLNHPDHVEHVLHRHHSNFDKRTRSAAVIKSVTGDSLLTANGEFWQRQRRLLQPAFHRESLEGFVSVMVQATEGMLDRLGRRGPAAGPLDLASEMTRLTYLIVGHALFEAEVEPHAAAIDSAMQVIMPELFERLGRVLQHPDWVPTPANRRFRRAMRTIDDAVLRIILEHRRAVADAEPGNRGGVAPHRGNLLTMMLRVRDEETGQGLDDRQLRNETITFLLAGHETTANALTWAFHLISRHPRVEDKLREEARSVLGSRSPAFTDLPRLSFTKMVVLEAMRLYPPIWIIERRVIKDDVIGGFHIPAGSAVVVSPFALHRHPAFWSDPETFVPERFEHPPPSAYIPFGTGPRFCIGREFAMLEAQIILAMVMRSIHLEPVPDHPVEPWPGITLRTRHGVLMTVSPSSK